MSAPPQQVAAEAHASEAAPCAPTRLCLACKQPLGDPKLSCPSCGDGPAPSRRRLVWSGVLFGTFGMAMLLRAGLSLGDLNARLPEARIQLSAAVAACADSVAAQGTRGAEADRRLERLDEMAATAARDVSAMHVELLESRRNGRVGDCIFGAVMLVVSICWLRFASRTPRRAPASPT